LPASRAKRPDGDRAAKVAWFSVSRRDEARIEWHKRSIAKLSGSELPKHDPQIEAVCADGAGRILLLQETPPRVELIDLESLRAVASIDLVVEGRGEMAQTWSDPKGSRGSGVTARRPPARRQGEKAGGAY
jgi:hypothetical protein